MVSLSRAGADRRRRQDRQGLDDGSASPRSGTCCATTPAATPSGASSPTWPARPGREGHGAGHDRVGQRPAAAPQAAQARRRRHRRPLAGHRSRSSTRRGGRSCWPPARRSSSPARSRSSAASVHAHPPRLRLAVGDGRARTSPAACIPVYPATAKLPSWQIAQGGRASRSTSCCRTGAASRPAARRAAPPARPALASSEALRLDPPARHPRRRTSRGRDRLRYDEAFVLQIVLARRRAEAAALPATPRRAAGRRPARRLRRAAAVHAHRRPAGGRRRDRRRPGAASTRCTGCCRARSARARPWSRCARCSRWSTRAARRRCSPRPRCWPSSTTARSPRMLGPLAERGLLGGSDIGTRVALLTGSQATAARRPRCSTSSAATPASSSAPTR